MTTAPGADRPLAGLHVLLVDDEVLVREVAGRMLASLGATVTHAGSGEEALALVAQDLPPAFDVLLLDRNLPGRSGDEVAAELRRRGVRTPILLGSGWGDGSDRAAAQLGAAGFVAKPYSLASLAAAIRAAVGRG